ncbi:hypothetical protein JXA02_11165 [candidate division KSB1 bacterium]|nr:hypothetical protein [candidate division KSB1 bacterium]RQW02769.1 MAG: hypothetical protein EH222_13280 [candidate division KSB1 bacterium]
MLFHLHKYYVVLSFILLFLISCGKDDNPVTTEDHDEHAEAVGCVIKQSDLELVRAAQGQLTGSFSVNENTESAMLSFFLVAQDGDLFQPEEDHFVLSWTSADPQIADIIHYEQDGAWNFRIKGLDAGSTMLQFKVLHGDHADFVSLDIPVNVSEDGGGKS